MNNNAHPVLPRLIDFINIHSWDSQLILFVIWERDTKAHFHLFLLPDSSKVYFLDLLHSQTSLISFTHICQPRTLLLCVSCVPGSLNYERGVQYPLEKGRHTNWNGLLFMNAYFQVPILCWLFEELSYGLACYFYGRTYFSALRQPTLKQSSKTQFVYFRWKVAYEICPSFYPLSLISSNDLCGYWFLFWLLSFKKNSRFCLCLLSLPLFILFKRLLTNSNQLTSFILSLL